MTCGQSDELACTRGWTHVISPERHALVFMNFTLSTSIKQVTLNGITQSQRKCTKTRKMKTPSNYFLKINTYQPYKIAWRCMNRNAIFHPTASLHSVRLGYNVASLGNRVRMFRDCIISCSPWTYRPCNMSKGTSFFRASMFLRDRTDTSEHEHVKEFFKITAVCDWNTRQ